MKTALFLLSTLVATGAMAQGSPDDSIQCQPAKGAHTSGKLAIGTVQGGNVQVESYLRVQDSRLHKGADSSSAQQAQIYTCLNPPNEYPSNDTMGQLHFEQHTCANVMNDGSIEAHPCRFKLQDADGSEMWRQWFRVHGQKLVNVAVAGKDKYTSAGDFFGKVQLKKSGGKSLLLV